jgi:hypothetical protein
MTTDGRDRPFREESLGPFMMGALPSFSQTYTSKQKIISTTNMVIIAHMLPFYGSKRVLKDGTSRSHSMRRDDEATPTSFVINDDSSCNHTVKSGRTVTFDDNITIFRDVPSQSRPTKKKIGRSATFDDSLLSTCRRDECSRREPNTKTKKKLVRNRSMGDSSTGSPIPGFSSRRRGMKMPSSKINKSPTRNNAKSPPRRVKS